MFLYEGDCLKNVTVIRGVRYVTVSHYSGDKEVCDKLGDMLTDAFRLRVLLYLGLILV